MAKLNSDGDFGGWATHVGSRVHGVTWDASSSTLVATGYFTSFTSPMQACTGDGCFNTTLATDDFTDVFVMQLDANTGLPPMPWPASITVSPATGLQTTEAGGSAAFEVKLNSAPSADVTIGVTSGDLSEGTVDVSSLTFTPANWNVPQLVTVTGVPDTELDGDVSYTIVLSPVVSTDLDYDWLQPVNVAVANLDDDVPTTNYFVVNDASSDRTYEYSASGSAVENYALASGNTAPQSAASTAAGPTLWVADKNRNVYVYDSDGELQGSWSAGALAANAVVEGLATDGTDVWIVDSKPDKVFRYANAAGRLSGSQTAASSFALNGSNKAIKMPGES